MFVIPALGRLRQRNHEFDVNLGYNARFYLKQHILICLLKWDYDGFIYQ